VAHTYNPSYPGGGRDQEDLGSSQPRQIVRPYLEKPLTKIGLVEWLTVKALSSSPSIPPKREKIQHSIDPTAGEHSPLCVGKGQK
jgi:hypothetical protein